DGSAVRMADKQGGFAHTAQRALDHGDVCRPGVEAVLRGHYLVPFSLQHGDYLVEARTVRPDSVTEHDARFSLRWLLHSGCLPRKELRLRSTFSLGPLWRYGLCENGRSACALRWHCVTNSKFDHA